VYVVIVMLLITMLRYHRMISYSRSHPFFKYCQAYLSMLVWDGADISVGV